MGKPVIYEVMLIQLHETSLGTNNIDLGFCSNDSWKVWARRIVCALPTASPNYNLQQQPWVLTPFSPWALGQDTAGNWDASLFPAPAPGHPVPHSGVMLHRETACCGYHTMVFTYSESQIWVASSSASQPLIESSKILPPGFCKAHSFVEYKC